jgi:tetratricopeptide (TPR) repeat protein
MIIKLLIRFLGYPLLFWKFGLFPLRAALMATTADGKPFDMIGGPWIVMYGLFFCAATVSISVGIVVAIELLMRDKKSPPESITAVTSVRRETNPVDADGLHERAKNYAAVGNAEAAISDLTKALRLAPQRAQVFLKLRHDIYRQQGKLQQALDDIIEANRLSQHGQEYLGGVATLYTQMGQPAEALRAFDEGIQRNPNNAMVRMTRAQFLEDAGMVREALADIDVAVSLTPANKRLYAVRAKICIKLKQFDQALADCNHLIKAEPEAGTHLRLRSSVYKAMGQADAAQDDYLRGLRLDPV